MSIETNEPLVKKKRKPLTRAQRIAHNLRTREQRAEKRRAVEKPTIKEIFRTKRMVLTRAVAAKVIENPTLPIGAALRAVGASESLATHPSLITTTKEWAELLDEYLPQGEVLEAHRNLLRASKIERLEFPRADTNEEEIRDIIGATGCTVRKVVTGESLYTVYFFAPDNRARKDALEMVYKLRGSYAADKAAVAFSLAALAASRDRPAEIAPPSSAPQLPRAVE